VENVAAPVVVETPVANVPKKPGRPSKYGTAMTPAQRKAESRKMQGEKQANKERRDIVAKYVKSYRRMLPIIKPTDPQWRSKTIEHRQRLRKFHDELMTLSLQQLKDALKVWEETPDQWGRLPGERSGESGRKHGMSEPERIISAEETDTGRVTPGGHGPAIDKDDERGDFRPPSGQRIPPEHIAFLEDREKIIGQLVSKFYDAERGHIIKNYEGEQHFEKKQCRLCGALIPDPSDVRQHFWEEYGKGLEAYYKYLELNEPHITELAPFIVEDARLRYTQNKHLQCVWSLARVQREDRRQETRKTRKARVS
jgi:hypothetical protein